MKIREMRLNNKLRACLDTLKRFLAFVGPGYVIAVGYLDPGNWATDLAGGSKHGYSLLFIIFLANIMAVLLQSLTVRLGVVTQRDLAENCRYLLPKYVNYALYVLAELAIIACDLAEVIGSALALNLLTGLALPWGVLVTGLDVLFILAFYREGSMRTARIFEAFVIVLVSLVGACFIVELVYANPNAVDVLKGYLPSGELFTNGGMLYIAIGIIGATVMPHNLYLHSYLVQVRAQHVRAQAEEEWRNFRSQVPRGSVVETAISSKDEDASDYHGLASPKKVGINGKSADQISLKLVRDAIRDNMTFSIVDTIFALTFALFVNSAILIVSAASFYYGSNKTDVASLHDAYDLLNQYLSRVAGFLFAFALLIAGQSSTLTATLAGSVVMNGYLGLTLRPWLRRILTRGLAIIPAMIVAISRGEQGLDSLLVMSQVALSIQLPFAVIPLVIFTSWKRVMRVTLHPRPADADLLERRESKADGEVKSEQGEPSSQPPEAEAETETEEKTEADAGADAKSNISKTNNNNSTVEEAEDAQYIDFVNPIWLTVLGGACALLLVGLNVFMLVQAFSGNVE
ncbi:uncharacterized protein VTP21DRAFT_3814 [Calcarisporiella thermophila]|uniref:uncharacterized protein n=1 Tax=Calcarisporiella thermophila TaxID=911321 RepID=UPI0037426DE6